MAGGRLPLSHSLQVCSKWMEGGHQVWPEVVTLRNWSPMMALVALACGIPLGRTWRGREGHLWRGDSVVLLCTLFPSDLSGHLAVCSGVTMPGGTRG